MSPRARGLALFACAALLRLGLWARMSPRPDAFARADSGGYLALADSMRAGRGFTLDGTAPDATRTPGYPAFLAAHRLVSSDPRFPALTQAFLDSGTAVLVAQAGLALGLGPAAWAGGLLYAVEPAAATHSVLLLTETLSTFLLAVSLLLACRMMRDERSSPVAAAAWGLALGAAALVRPVNLYLTVPWAAAMLLSRRNLFRPLLLGAALSSALTLSWCARNAAVLGSFSFTSITGASLLFWEAPAVLSVADGIPYGEAQTRLEADFKAAHPGPLDAFDESRLRRAEAKRILRAHPGAMLKTHVLAVARILLGPALDLVDDELFPAAPPDRGDSGAFGAAGAGTLALARRKPLLWGVLALTLAVLGAAYALAAAGVFALRRRKDAAAAVLAPLAYLLVLSSGGWAYYRFRVPLWPFVCVLAAAGAAAARRRDLNL